MSETKRKQFRRRRESSSSSASSDVETNEEAKTENTKEKIEELKLLQKLRERKHGIDVYSLAIGEQKDATEKQLSVDNDPWKSQTGGLVDMKRLKEKRGAEIVQNMHSNFAKETNQRDEDAEMQKFIEEQLRLKKETESTKLKETDKQTESLIQLPQVAKFKRPEDALFDVPKYLLENTSKHKSEETLSEQMLSGIPEVDLGIDERIRNIEDTEKARQDLLRKKAAATPVTTNTQTRKSNITNSEQQQYVQHKRFDDTLLNQDQKQRQMRPNTSRADANQSQPVVGDAPKHELLQQQGKHKLKHDSGEKKEDRKSTSKKSKHHNNNPQNQNEKASDDFCVERFKKNMRFNRNSKIKIC